MKTFNESQGLKSPLLYIVLSGLLFFSIFAVLSQVVLGTPVGNNPMPDWGLIAMGLFALFLLFLTLLSKLRTAINTKSLVIDFKPLGREEIPWTEVKKIKMARLNMVSIGRRYSKQLGHVYNAGAKEALSIELKNGRKLLISTRKPEELKKFLKQIKKL